MAFIFFPLPLTILPKTQNQFCHDMKHHKVHDRTSSLQPVQYECN